MRSRNGPGGTGASTIEYFRRELGEAVVEGGDAVQRYRCAGVVPSCVLLPRTVEEVRAAVAAAAGRALALVPSGNRTHLHIGFPPRRYDAALCTRLLNRVLAHEPADMTVSVEAGVTLAALNDVLGRAGQWLPIDPACADGVTVGGMIAADRNGPLRLAYGRVRDHLIGLSVVMADGALVRGGGRVVKNVAGYDLPKLFVGSFGTLGVIVEASLKVRPRPAHERVFVRPTRSVEESVTHALSLLDSPVTPVLLEAVSDRAAAAIGLHPEPALIVGCAGTPAEIDAHEAHLRGQCSTPLSVCDGAAAPSVLTALRDFPKQRGDDALIARLSTVPASLPWLLARVEAEAAARGLPVEIAAHAGNGVAWCRLAAGAELCETESLVNAMRTHARAQNGWLVCEALPSALSDRVDPWGYATGSRAGGTSGSATGHAEGALVLMRRVKRAFDPGGLFSPGRFVGRI